MPWECVLSACGSAHARVCSWDLVHCVTLQGQFFQTYQVLINGNFLLINDTDLFFSFSFFLLFSLSLSHSLSPSPTLTLTHSITQTEVTDDSGWNRALSHQPISQSIWVIMNFIDQSEPLLLFICLSKVKQKTWKPMGGSGCLLVFFFFVFTPVRPNRLRPR